MHSLFFLPQQGNFIKKRLCQVGKIETVLFSYLCLTFLFTLITIYALLSIIPLQKLSILNGVKKENEEHVAQNR